MSEWFVLLLIAFNGSQFGVTMVAKGLSEENCEKTKQGYERTISTETMKVGKMQFYCVRYSN